MPPALRPVPKVLSTARAAARAAAADRALLRRLLQQSLPADLLARLDIEALIAAIVATATVDESVTAPGSDGEGAPPTPPSKASAVNIRVTQALPGVPASAVDNAALGDKLAEELNRRLASQGLSAEVTATATDASSGGSSSGTAAGHRHLLQASGSYGGGCILVYIIVVGGAPGQAPSAVTAAARSASLTATQDTSVLRVLLQVSHLQPAQALCVTCLGLDMRPAWPGFFFCWLEQQTAVKLF